jgi:phenylacetate-CoA ligase
MNGTSEETLTPTAIDDLQEAAWQETFRHVAIYSPFYREHFQRAGLSAQSRVRLRDLSAIPPITKTVLSEHGSAFLCVPQRQVVDVVTTSGSTGRPLLWMLTERDLERLALNEQLSFRCAGLSATDTVLLAVTLDRCFMAGLAYFLGLRRLGCAVLRAGPAAPLLHLEMLRQVRASAIVGVPSFLCLLADKAREMNLDLAAAGVRSAICIGEPVRQQDFTLNRAGQTIAERWQARVFSTYGVTEMAASLCECGTGRGGHMHPQLLYLEALDATGQPVPDGEVGELTVTTFGVEAMPLVRYRTGDFAALYRDPCPCGRSTPRVGPIAGRKDHKLKLKGTTVFPSSLQAVLERTPEVHSFVIVARRDNPLSDAVEVKVCAAGDAAALCSTLRDRFRGEVKVTPTITLASSAEIESLQMPEGARKRRFFVDLRD